MMEVVLPSFDQVGIGIELKRMSASDGGSDKD